MEGVSRDEPLSERLCKKWDEILAQLKQLSTIKIEKKDREICCLYRYC